MAKKKGKSGLTPKGGALGKTKKWCSGKIWFTKDGCLYVNDKTLAEAILRKYLETGKLCVTIPDDFSPTKEMNILCSC